MNTGPMKRWLPKLAKIMILGKSEKMVNLAKMANLEQMAKNHHAPWRVAILARMEKFFRGLAIQLGWQKWPLGEWRFWRKWQNLTKRVNLAQTAKNRQRVSDIQNMANIQIGCQVAPLLLLFSLKSEKYL